MVRPKQEQLTIVWLVLTASIGVYAIIVSVATSQSLPGEVSQLKSLAFCVLGLALAAGCVLVPRKLLSNQDIHKLMRDEPDLRTLATPIGAREPDLEKLRDLSALHKIEQRLIVVLTASRTPYFVGLAFSAALALLGLVFGLSSQNMFASLPLLVGAMALNGYHYPRLEKLFELARRLQKDEVMDGLDKALKVMEKDLGTRKAPRLRKPSHPHAPAHPHPHDHPKPAATPATTAKPAHKPAHKP